MSNNTWIRFEYGALDKMPVLKGPFDWLQITYSEIYDDKDNILAHWNGNFWLLDDNEFSDFVVFAHET